MTQHIQELKAHHIFVNHDVMEAVKEKWLHAFIEFTARDRALIRRNLQEKVAREHNGLVYFMHLKLEVVPTRTGYSVHLIK